MFEVIQFLRLMSKPHLSLARKLVLPHAILTITTTTVTIITTTKIFIFLSKIISLIFLNSLVTYEDGFCFEIFQTIHILNCIVTLAKLTHIYMIFDQMYSIQLGIMSVIQSIYFLFILFMTDILLTFKAPIAQVV
jgi:hypothetical protein